MREDERQRRGGGGGSDIEYGVDETVDDVQFP